MAAQNDIKQQLLAYLPSDARILATATAKVYHSPFGGKASSWSHSGLSGILIFGRDRIHLRPDRRIGTGPGSSVEQNFWFRLVDLQTGKGLVWMHQISDDIQYRLDKPFFHEFRGKTRMFGFRFDDDVEANKFYKKVTSHLRASPPSPVRKRTIPSFNPLKRFIPSQISSPAPGTFVHLSHVGFNEKGRIEVSDDSIEAGWTMMLEELQGHGVSEDIIEDDHDFVEGFWAGVKATSPKEAKLKLHSEDSNRTQKTIRRKPVTNFPK